MKKSKTLLIVLITLCSIFSVIEPIEVHAVAKMSLAQLRAKFPHGKYWNHVGSSKNNPDGWTSTPCKHHGVEESGCSFSGSCGCNNVGNGTYAIQCAGFAYKLGLDAFGSHPKSWNKKTGSSARSYVKSNLKAGDICRINNNGHSIFITKVSGNTVTFTDCNRDGRCVITWGRTMTKSQLASKLTYVLVAPSTFSKYDFKISFDNNGGSGKISSMTVGYEAYFTLPSASKFKKEGHTFAGYALCREDDQKYMCEDGKFRTQEEIEKDQVKEKIFQAKDKIQASKKWTDSPSKQKKYTFEARWEVNTYSLIYNGNEGIGEMETQSGQYGQELTLLSNTYYNEHYSFAGWYVYSQKQEKWLCLNEEQYNWSNDLKQRVLLDNEATISSLPVKQDDVLELYASWTPDTLIVKYDGGLFAEGEMEDTIVSYNQTSLLNKNIFTKNHHEFIGWHIYSSKRCAYLYTYNNELVWFGEYNAPANAHKVTFLDESEINYVSSICDDEIIMKAVWKHKHKNFIEQLLCSFKNQ